MRGPGPPRNKSGVPRPMRPPVPQRSFELSRLNRYVLDLRHEGDWYFEVSLQLFRFLVGVGNFIDRPSRYYLTFDP